MTFRDYVRGRRVTRTHTGDFVRDARSDDTFPDAKTWDQLYGYLLNVSACPEAIKAGRVVWRGYKRRASHAA